MGLAVSLRIWVVDQPVHDRSRDAGNKGLSHAAPMIFNREIEALQIAVVSAIYERSASSARNIHGSLKRLSRDQMRHS